MPQKRNLRFFLIEFYEQMTSEKEICVLFLLNFMNR